ncbi:MAG: flagellar hook-length control protein FliK, partial [Eubacteriales bacterium]|nr:flagellar hook-length control protein FliK [Eubacteriales bacterium]
LKPQEEPLPAYSQISKEIMKRLDQKGPTEFRMSLEPADLGQIEIKLQISNGKLVIDIAALNSKTQTLLASQVDNLVMSMGLQNVKVEVIQAGSNSMTAHETLENQTQAYATGNSAAFSQNSQSSFSQKDSSGNLNRLVASVIRNSESQVNNIDLSAMALSQRPNVTRMDYTI